MDDESKKTKGLPQSRGSMAIIITAVAGAAAFLGNVDKISSLWCSYIGFVCTYNLTSPTVSEASGGTSRNSSDICKEHKDELCINKSTRFRSIITSSVRFEIHDQSGGALLDGGAPGNDPIGTHRIGWFITQNSTDKACAIVFARTSACETKVSITGQLTAKEKWKWRPW